MLSLPCFPSTDGPVHMYFVHVLGSLLTHSDPVLAKYFVIRHILPPYSLYYYALLGLSKIVPMLLADRLVICAYFVSFLFGFRYLARAIGPSADRMTLLATLLLLNWPLGMGFVNFCLALSFSLWATGLWLRLAGTRNVRGRVAFLVLVTATMLTHPVPLLLLLAVVGVLLAERFFRASRLARRFAVPQNGWADLLTFALATLNLGYVKIFAKANLLHQSKDVAPVSYGSEYLQRLGSYYGRQHALGFLLGRRPDLLVYRAALVLLLVVPIALAVHQWRKNRAAGGWTTGSTFLLIGIAALAILPILPSQLNGSYYFADRLVLCVWLAFLLAASGWSASTSRTAASRNLALLCVVFALIANASLLIAANRLVRPAARTIAALDRVSIHPTDQIGFLLEDPREGNGAVHEGTSWDPYTWALAHVFRRSNAVMANPPWMDVTIIPIGPTPDLPEVSVAALQQPILIHLQDDLLRSPEDLATTLRLTDFFLVNQSDRDPSTAEPLLQAAGPAAANWSCTTQGWYRVCRRPPADFTPGR